MRIFGYNISITRGHPYVTSNTEPKKPKVTGIDPGRVSAPEDGINGLTYALKDFNTMVDPSFRVEVIQLLRNLYKVNPDVSKALQDMYQLANTGHRIGFPNNTSKEAEAMVDHLKKASKKWSNYTAGTDGLVNKKIGRASCRERV